jgi:GNAT superfamily N-acetyltransferase
MAGLSVTPASDKSELEQFATFPWKVYEGDPHWVPNLLSEQRKLFDSGQNPFFEHADAEFFLARRNGKVVGTIAAFTNHLYNEIHESASGFFGFFEVLDEPEVAAELLAAAEDWARRAGHSEIIGPMQYSTNDELGLLVDGFDDAPRILMTYNPPRYQGYIEGAGYEKAVDLWAYAMDISDLRRTMPEKVRRVRDKIIQRWDLKLRSIDMKRYYEEAQMVLQIYNRAWEPNWGAVRMTEAEAELVAEQLKQILDPDMALVLERDGMPVAFGITLPDLNQPLRLAYPRPGTPEIITLLKLLWHWKVRPKMTWARAWGLGILPEYQGQGLESLMLLEMAEAAHRKGYQHGEMSWVLESNDKVNRSLAMIDAEVYKTYRIYKKAL